MNNDWSLRLLSVGKGERTSRWGGSPLPGRGGGRTRRKRGKTCGVPGPLLPAQRPGDNRPVERGSQPAFRSPCPLPTDAWPPRWALRPPPTRGFAATEEGSGTPPHSAGSRWTLWGVYSLPRHCSRRPGAHTLAHGPGERPLSPRDVAPGLSSPAPPSLSPRPFAALKGVLTPASGHGLPGPCHLPELHPSVHSEPA